MCQWIEPGRPALADVDIRWTCHSPQYSRFDIVMAIHELPNARWLDEDGEWIKVRGTAEVGDSTVKFFLGRGMIHGPTGDGATGVS